jgi:hypothetical protein
MINNKLLLTAGAVAISTSLLSTSATAVTVGATGNANVLAPISITENTQMEFGDVAGEPVGGIDTTVILTTSGGTSSPDGATVFASGNTDAAGAFTVNGANDKTFSISLPADGDVSLGGALPVNNFGHDIIGTPTLSATGSATFNVGADLTIPAGQAPNPYSATYNVTVNYQ